MKYYKILFLTLGLLGMTPAVLMTGCRRNENAPQKTADQIVHEDPQGYWTCPMHPQIHQHEKGTCPICGMGLVHVDSHNKTEKKSPDTSSLSHTNGIQVMDKQLGLVAIGRYVVLRKDLAVNIPVSGSVLSSQEIVLQIYESDLALVRTGRDFSGFSRAAPQELLKGKITKIDAMVDPTTRTLKIVGTLDHPIRHVVSNGGFHGAIIVQLKNQIVIPEGAVLHTGTRDLVYLISSDNRVSPLAVTLGSKSAEEYQIVAGLNEGDIISTGPNFLLDSESKIRGGNDQTSH